MTKQLYRYFRYTTNEQVSESDKKINELLNEGWLVKISYPLVYGADNRYQGLVFIFEKNESVAPSIR